MTGFDVVDQLQQHPAAREIPILVFTAKDLTSEERERLNGHVGTITSKSGREELLRELGTAIAERGRLRDGASGAGGREVGTVAGSEAPDES